MKVDGTEVRRLAHHRSRRVNDYWYQPRAAIARDASAVVFDSNFGDDPPAFPDYTDTYLIDLR